LPAGFDDPFHLMCEQGQARRWPGLHEAGQWHWSGVSDPRPLCPWGWRRSACLREFSFRPQDHEILSGTIPFGSRVGQQLLRQARSWIEATQSYEKNQLGLSQFFLNSLRLTWTVCLPADTGQIVREASLSNPRPGAGTRHGALGLLQRRKGGAAVPGGECWRRLAASSITGRDVRPARRRDAGATRPVGMGVRAPAPRCQKLLSDTHDWLLLDV